MSTMPAIVGQQTQIDHSIYTMLGKIKESNPADAQSIYDYIVALKTENVAGLGVDEAFTLRDEQGVIKAFKQSLTLSEADGTLVQPAFNGPHVISAQGYEAWADAVGASVIFPKEVLVDGEMRLNPHAERDPNNRRILAVHARAIAFKYSSKGIPQVSDWTTIFDTPTYRLIDLLGKAKKTPQAFKLLPSEMAPPEGGTWSKYPFDESSNLWVDTSHGEALTWFAQILNREKKSMDFAQTFAKRNALKHLSALQKAPCNQWILPVICWRPVSGNIIKWDAAQYSELQERVTAIIDGGSNEGFHENIEVKTGKENVSDDENFEALEAATDPEDQQPAIEVKPESVITETASIERPFETTIERPAKTQQDPNDVYRAPEVLAKRAYFKRLNNSAVKLSDEDKKVFRNLEAARLAVPGEYNLACQNLSINPDKVETVTQAESIVFEINKIIDTDND